jgi:hypothetical protein
MGPNMKERTKKLVLQREGFRKGLEAFRTVLNNYVEGTHIYTIQRNLEELEVEFTSFKKDQWELDDRNGGQTQQDRIDLQQMLYVFTEHVTTIINNANKQSKSTIRSFTSSYSNISLPKIHLPTFSETYKDWPEFADQFRSTVHDTPRIDNYKRVTYLRSSSMDVSNTMANPKLSECSSNTSSSYQRRKNNLNNNRNNDHTLPTEDVVSNLAPIPSHDTRSSLHNTRSAPTRDLTTTKLASSLSEQSDSTLPIGLNQTISNVRKSAPIRDLTTTKLVSRNF